MPIRFQETVGIEGRDVALLAPLIPFIPGWTGGASGPRWSCRYYSAKWAIRDDMLTLVDVTLLQYQTHPEDWIDTQLSEVATGVELPHQAIWFSGELLLTTDRGLKGRHNRHTKLQPDSADLLTVSHGLVTGRQYSARRRTQMQSSCFQGR